MVKSISNMKYDNNNESLMEIVSEVAASSTSSRTVFEVLGLGLEGQVLSFEPSRSSKIGLSLVEAAAFCFLLSHTFL